LKKRISDVKRQEVRRFDWTRFAPAAAALIVAGSGIQNLYSLLGSQREARSSLRFLFSLDFTGLNRSATLLLGFFLILTGIHLISGKRRALQLAIGFSLASIVIHVTFLRNTQQALSASLLAILLTAARRAFRMGSGKPELTIAMKRAALALTIASLYGVLGFWLLEAHEFGKNFHWWEAAERTLRVMLLIDYSGLSPRTAYAFWFLDSLYLMAGATFAYCGFTLFRPVTYRFQQSQSDLRLAHNIAHAHGRTPQDFFKQWPDKTFFFSRSGRSFIAYRVAGNFALALGDPVGPDDDILPAIEQFVEFCRHRGWRTGFHQVHPDRLEVFRRLGFHHLRIGEEAVVDLTSFSLRGSAMKEFRNSVTRLDRLGYEVKRLEPPHTAHVVRDLKSVSDEWLSIPGNKERGFTLGHFDLSYVSSTRIYAAFDPGGRAAAFLNLVPCYHAGLETVDLMRRRPAAVNGVMDYLFAKTFLDLQSAGVQRFSLGMTPGAAFKEGESPTAQEKAVSWAMTHFPSLFRAESLRRFKAKYAQYWEPRYAVFQSRWDLARLALALRRISAQKDELRRAA
jgi:phosphatidylglycerol lysyltransferase